MPRHVDVPALAERLCAAIGGENVLSLSVDGDHSLTGREAELVKLVIGLTETLPVPTGAAEGK